MGWSQLYTNAAARHGVASRRCALTAGVAPSTFLGRARREGWAEPFAGAFVLPGWDVNGFSRTVAGAMWAGAEAVVTGASALALHGLIRTPPTRLEILVPDNHRSLDHPRVRTRWTRELADAAIDTVAGTPTTDVARSLAEHAADATAGRLLAIAIDAWVRGLLTTGGMDREINARGRFPGRGRYRGVRAALDGDGSESGFEFDVRRRLAACGLTPDDDQAEVVTPEGRRRIDVPFSRELVGVECVGFAYHSSPRQLERDVIRSNAIATLDRWLILRLTFAMFHQRWEPFVAQLRGCLDRRRRPPA